MSHWQPSNHQSLRAFVVVCWPYFSLSNSAYHNVKKHRHIVEYSSDFNILKSNLTIMIKTYFKNEDYKIVQFSYNKWYDMSDWHKKYFHGFTEKSHAQLHRNTCTHFTARGSPELKLKSCIEKHFANQIAFDIS